MSRVVVALAGVLLAAGAASAQPGGPIDEGGAAPAGSAAAASGPIEEASPRVRERERVTAETAELNPLPEDPTLHFNFFNFNYRGKDEFGGPFGDGVMTDEVTHETTHDEEPMSPPFILALINFAIFLALLVKYLVPAANKLARDRHDEIKTALDEAAELRARAASKLAEYESRIKDVDKEIEALVAGIRADAEADKQRILENAARQAEQMKRDAAQRIAAEIETARAKLTEEVAAAASAATTQLLRDKTTPDDQHKLVSTFITGLGGN